MNYYLPTGLVGINNKNTTQIQIMALYNNTMIWIDEDMSGKWDNGGITSACEEYTANMKPVQVLQKGELWKYPDTSNYFFTDDCGTGAWLKSNKPIYVGYSPELIKGKGIVQPIHPAGTEWRIRNFTSGWTCDATAENCETSSTVYHTSPNSMYLKEENLTGETSCFYRNITIPPIHETKNG